MRYLRRLREKRAASGRIVLDDTAVAAGFTTAKARERVWDSSDLSFSTDCAPEAARFDAWREFNHGAFGVLLRAVATGAGG